MWTQLIVLLSRLRAAVLGDRLDADFRDELRAHLDLLTADQQRLGALAGEAGRRASLRLGGLAQLEEERRERRGIPLVEDMMRDLRYAARSLRRSPVFTIVSIATLAVGIGAGTMVFSFAGAVLLRPLPYAQPDQLVRIFETNPLRRWTRNTASPANYADWRAANGVFTDMAAWEQYAVDRSGADVFLTGHGDPQPLTAARVTSSLFDVLGVAPLLGRTFTPEETFEGRGRVVILSHGLWRDAFASDPAILGRTIMLSGAASEVVGVMPPGFFFPGRDVHLWQPVGYAPSVFINSRRPHWLGVIARRKPATTLAQADADMDRIARALAQQYPDTNTRMGVRLEPFQRSLAHGARPALLMLSGAVGLLFVIVCANLASLQLGRAIVRAGELATRRALGAGRGRLVRQLVIESLVLSAAGGALGLALAAAGTALFVRLAGDTVPLFASVDLDWSAAACAASLSLLAPVLFGVLPALSASRSHRLSGRAASAPPETAFLRGILVAAEVALSIVLVAGSALLIRSLVRLSDVDPGFNPDRVVAFTMTLPFTRYPTPDRQLAAFAAIEQGLRSQPGLQSIGASSVIALRGATWTGDFTIEGRAADDYERDIRHSSITAGYFRTMGIRLLHGRTFDERDRADRPGTTIVNDSLVRKFFRGEHPVGRRVRFGRPQDTRQPWLEIVGVVADEKQDGMDTPAEPLAYQSLDQRVQNPLTFVIRTAIGPEAAIAAARRQVALVDKDLALTSVATMQSIVDESMAEHRFRTVLLSSFAAIALLLAALGTYGVLVYMISQRSRELAIRQALGSTRTALFRLVMSQGLRPVAAGTIVGVVSALAMTRVIESLLFEVRALDPAAFGVAIALIAGAGIAACAVPAWRATRTDALMALRDS
jgi:putative ABC transport system permease protein